MAQHLPDELLLAADRFEAAAKLLLTHDGRLHAESVIASMARMSGSLLFRSHGLDRGIEPGTVVLSPQANAEGPKLMDAMLLATGRHGQPVSEAEINRAYASAAHTGISFKESHDRLAPSMLKYCETEPLGLRTAALAAALATGSLILACAPVLAPRDGAGVAVYGLIEGSKTAPWPVSGLSRPPIADSLASAKAAKPWYRFW